MKDQPEYNLVVELIDCGVAVVSLRKSYLLL